MKRIISKQIERVVDYSTTLDSFHSELDTLKALWSSPTVKNIAKDYTRNPTFQNSPIYFDDTDFVFIDQTVVPDCLFDPAYSLQDLIDALAIQFPPKVKRGSGVGLMAGRFAYSRESDTRAVFAATSQEANELKRFHSARDGIKVRLMSRNQGFKVYIDTNDARTLDNVLQRISQI